jgi:hypothetical protein
VRVQNSPPSSCASAAMISFPTFFQETDESSSIDLSITANHVISTDFLLQTVQDHKVETVTSTPASELRPALLIQKHTKNFTSKHFFQIVLMSLDYPQVSSPLPNTTAPVIEDYCHGTLTPKTVLKEPKVYFLTIDDASVIKGDLKTNLNPTDAAFPGLFHSTSLVTFFFHSLEIETTSKPLVAPQSASCSRLPSILPILGKGSESSSPLLSSHGLILSVCLFFFSFPCPVKEEPGPKKPPTPTDDNGTDEVAPPPDVAPPPRDVYETTSAIGRLLCGYSPFGIRDLTRTKRSASSPLPCSPCLTPLLLAISGTGLIAVSLLLLLLTKRHLQDIAFFATVTVLLVLRGAIGPLDALYRSTGTLREVRFLPFLLLSVLSTHPPSPLPAYDQREHATESDALDMLRVTGQQTKPTVSFPFKG